MLSLSKKISFGILIFVLCFFMINISYYFYSKPRNIPGALNYGMKKLSEIYPGWSREDIKDLLIETWTIPFVFEPVTQFKERPCKGKFVNIDKNGFRNVKNQGPWPVDSDAFNIFIFGGSTAFGYGVDDSSTIASRLQEILSKNGKYAKVYIYNFGRGFYYSSDERLVFQELLISGAIPSLAIFIDGLNDANSYETKRGGFLTEEIAAFINNPWKSLLLRLGTSFKSLPMFTLFERLKMRLRNLFSRRKDEKNIELKIESDLMIVRPSLKDDAQQKTAEGVIERYKNNKAMLEAIGDRFGVKTLFVWQPVPDYQYDDSYHIFWNEQKEKSRFMIKLSYVEMKKKIGEFTNSGNFLYLGGMGKDIKKALYVDIHHYSPEFSLLIAKRISDYVIKKGLFTKKGF